MTVEPAGIDDLEAVGRLYEELYSCLAALQPEFFRRARQSAEFLRGMIEKDGGDILAARGPSGEVVGIAVVQTAPTPAYPCFLPRRYTCLMDLVVTEACRGQGVGRALLEEAERWARDRGSEFVELGVLGENLPAIGLYESLGFRESRKVMQKDL